MPRFHFRILFFVNLIAVAPALAQSLTSAQTYYLEARRLIAPVSGKQDWPGAAMECRAALREQPDYPEALNLLGIALTEMNQPAEAVPVLQEALKQRANYPEAHLSLGLAYQAQSQSARALAEYRAAVAERTGYTAARVALGKALVNQKQNVEARQELDAAFQQDPDLPEIYYLLSRLDMQSGNASEAQIELRQVNQLNKRRAQAAEAVRLSNAGLDAANQGDLLRAVALLRGAVAAKPDDALAHYNLGLVLADTGHLGDGIAEVRVAISLDGGVTKMQGSLGRMQERAQREQVSESRPDTLASIGQLLHTLTADPANFDARYNLAVAWLQAGNTGESTLEFYKLVKLRPHSAAAHFGLGLALRESGEQGAAAREFSAALKAQPDYPNARYYLEISQSKLK